MMMGEKRYDWEGGWEIEVWGGGEIMGVKEGILIIKRIIFVLRLLFADVAFIFKADFFSSLL